MRARAAAWLGAIAVSACSVRPVTFTPVDDGARDAGEPDGSASGPPTFTVDIGLIGSGAGTVTSMPAGIACPGTCATSVPEGTTIVLVAAPSATSTFLGWSGACTILATGACSITVTSNLGVTAAFAADNELIVMKAGNGSGTVSSILPGISCGSDCAEPYPPGTAVRLAATAAASSTFTGWSGGGCTGTGPCVVTVNSAVAVTASFVLQQFVLTVTTAGNGSGSVQSTPVGISCGAGCSHAYDVGTAVTLAQTPAAGSTFAGWSGACTGTAACQVTIARATAVTAAFARPARLVVSNFNLPVSLEVFAGSADGNAAPLQVIAGPATTFAALRGVAVVNNEIIVVDQSGAAIDVFPVTATGNVAPVRRIVGAATGLDTPAGVLVSGGEIYVNQQTGSIVVFPLNANGNVAPSRTITGIGQGNYLAITGGEIYATDVSGNRVLVFPAGASGAVTPTRIIGGPTAGLSGPTGLLVSNGEIFVASPGTEQIRVFAQAANGDAAPLRVVGGTNVQLGFPDQLAIFGGELYVSNFNNSTVVVVPVGANGNVVPTRRIVGAATQLSNPVGTFVF